MDILKCLCGFDECVNERVKVAVVILKDGSVFCILRGCTIWTWFASLLVHITIASEFEISWW